MLATPLQHVAQQHRGKADGSDEETQSSERFESREVGVLDSMKGGQAFGGRRDIKAVVRERRLERTRNIGRILSGHIQQKESVTGLIGKYSKKVFFGDEQLALKNAVRQRRYQS